MIKQQVLMEVIHWTIDMGLNSCLIKTGVGQDFCFFFKELIINPFLPFYTVHGT